MRSTRCSDVPPPARAPIPQLRAMSLALLAQGDTVPSRGVTITAWPPAGPAYGSP